MHPCCASGVSDGDVRRDSRQASDRDRPCATLRISLNPVRSSIIQDLRLLPIDSSLVSQSPGIFLFLSVFLADKCVFQVMSINKSMSSNKKLLSFVKLVKLFVSCIQKCYPSKIFRGSAPNPAGLLNAPQIPHLQSTSIHRWLRPWHALSLQKYLYAIEDFSKDCPGTRYGALLARKDCDVCASGLICHLFFDFGKPTIDHCCVPRFSNGRRTSPSLSYHSFPLSSELRKHWLVALVKTKEQTFAWVKAPFNAVGASSEKFSLSFWCPRVCGLFHYRSWQSKES